MSSPRWGALCVLVLATAASTAHAYPGDVTPSYPGTIYECQDCHVHPSGSCSTTSHPRRPCLNPFGRTYLGSAWSASLAAQDRDGDGYTNSAELSSAGSAGFQKGAESVGCSMLSAATVPGTFSRCASGNVEVRATYSTSGAHNYSFSFRCTNGTTPSPLSSDVNWSDRCLDPNECSANPCAPGSCAQQRPGAGWTPPGYKCSCPAGYVATTTGCQLVTLDRKLRFPSPSTAEREPASREPAP